MKITIDEDVCKKNGMRWPEVLIAMIIRSGEGISLLIQEMLIEQKIIKDEIENEYLVTQRWTDIVDTILLDSEDAKQPESRLDALIPKLQGIFPEGKKEGTSQYWRGNRREIGIRLKKFFKLYGNTYTDEQILGAATNYVQGFNGRYSYMRVLKYFIWKDDRRPMEDGEIKVIEVSDLANYIENANSDNLKDDWTSQIN